MATAMGSQFLKYKRPSLDGLAKKPDWRLERGQYKEVTT